MEEVVRMLCFGREADFFLGAGWCAKRPWCWSWDATGVGGTLS